MLSVYLKLPLHQSVRPRRKIALMAPSTLSKETAQVEAVWWLLFAVLTRWSFDEFHRVAVGWVFPLVGQITGDNLAQTVRQLLN